MSNAIDLHQHAPYRRLITDETTAIDRQWVGMLADLLKDVSCELLAQHLPTGARDLLGIVALQGRLDS